MADLYTCICGNQTWQIHDTGVRCATCQSEFQTRLAPVTEFNRMVTQEMEEEMEEV